MLTGVLKIIPMAHRMAAGTDSASEQTHMAHTMFPLHGVMMVNTWLLIAVQVIASYGK